MCQHIRKNKITSKDIQAKIAMASVMDKMGKVKLMIQTYEEDKQRGPAKRCEKLTVVDLRLNKGRPRKIEKR